MMFRFLGLLVLLLPLAGLQAMAVQAPAQAGPLSDTIDLIDANVLFLRHALAPGFGDPSAFRIDDCATQRNLDEAGRRQSRKLGAYLNGEGIGFDEILSSRWCRCVDTAAEMDIGNFTIFDGLNSFFDGHVDRNATLALLAEKLATLPEDGLVLMVTHQVVISAITGIPVRYGRRAPRSAPEGPSANPFGTNSIDQLGMYDSVDFVTWPRWGSLYNERTSAGSTRRR